ncbi:MAG: oligopeptide/dipeptide ABC transporter ATP-binding protein, partial [Anaerolineaceae bacterium]
VGLLSAIPKITGERQRLASIPGLVANARMLPEGCKFHPRCAKCSPVCRTRKPTVIRVNEDHIVYCLKCEQSHD